MIRVIEVHGDMGRRCLCGVWRVAAALVVAPLTYAAAAPAPRTWASLNKTASECSTTWVSATISPTATVGAPPQHDHARTAHRPPKAAAHTAPAVAKLTARAPVPAATRQAPTLAGKPRSRSHTRAVVRPFCCAALPWQHATVFCVEDVRGAVKSTPSAGSFLNFVSASTRVPHGGASYVQMSKRTRVDRHSCFIERLFFQVMPVCKPEAASFQAVCNAVGEPPPRLCAACSLQPAACNPGRA